MLGLVLLVNTRERTACIQEIQIGEFQSQDHIYTDLLYEWVDKAFVRLVEDPREVCEEYNMYTDSPLCHGYYLECENLKKLPETITGVEDLRAWRFPWKRGWSATPFLTRKTPKRTLRDWKRLQWCTTMECIM